MIKKTLDEKAFHILKDKMVEGLLPQWVLTDPDMFDLELEKVYGRTWQFLGHETEIEEPGSYVTRWMANDPVILLRNRNGEIKAFLNSCSHRGTQLCTADRGNKKAFSCPYHGWTYNLDGDLIGIVAGHRVFGGEMDKSEWGLRKIPQVGVYQGMIFGSLDLNAMPLEQYLGDMKWYFDILPGRSDGGMEVRGIPQRWVAKANWKATAENFAADPYHVQTTHRSTVEIGISPEDPFYAGYGHQIVLDNGHGINVITSKTGEARVPFQGMPESMWPMFKKNLTPEQLHVLSKVTVFVGGVYPNLSFVSPIHGTEGDLHNYLNFRVWRPIAPDQVEVWSWFLIDKAAPEEYKEAAYKGYLGSFGPSGTLEQDDTENWARIVEVSKGLMMRDKHLNYNSVSNYLMGFNRVEPDENFPGPGTAYPTTYLDAIARSMHENWLKLISEGLFEKGGSPMNSGLSVEITPALHLEITNFLYLEAYYLDHGHYNEWLDMLSDDIEYRMPLRETIEGVGAVNISKDMAFFDESKASLATRVKRLYTKSAWVENPATRQRHFITNIMIEATSNPNEFKVRSYFLFQRSRGSTIDIEQVFGERNDILRKVNGECKIASRTILPDQAVITLMNMSMFL